MSDLVDFSPDFVPNRYADQLQRRAVLVPLIGKIRLGELMESSVIAGTQQLIQRWRLRVDQLAQAGWAPLAGADERAARNRLYAKNCLPTFFKPQETTRCCQLRDVCPFCWARRARETWEAVDFAFFASLQARKDASEDAPAILPSSPRFDLIELRWSNVLPRWGHDTTTDEPVERLPHFLCDRVERRTIRHRNCLKSGVLGGLQILQSTTSGTDWLVHHELLWLVPAGFKVPARLKELKEKGTIQLVVYRQPRRKEVLGAVARTCRYPKCLMTGDPEAIVRLLDARKVAAAIGERKTLQLAASFGMFRNRAARRRDA